MILSLLAPLVGIFGSAIPSVIRMFERKQEFKHEIDLLSARTEAAKIQSEFQIQIENVKADAIEGKSLYDHDSSIDGGGFINALRASIRPVITYIFFAVFVAVKISAAYVMIMNGAPIPEMIKAVWDTETMALFSTILAFWFGSRTLEKMGTRVINSYNAIPATTVKKK
jgi:hypothetical protein